MNVLILRRIFAGTVIISLFLPWINFYFGDLTGLNIALKGLEYSDEISMFGQFFGEESLDKYTTLFSILLIGILLLAISIFIWPIKGVVAVFAMFTFVTVIPFYVSDELNYVRDSGVTVATIGLIGSFISIFLKEGAVKRPTISTNQGQHNFVNPQAGVKKQLNQHKSQPIPLKQSQTKSNDAKEVAQSLTPQTKVSSAAGQKTVGAGKKLTSNVQLRKPTDKQQAYKFCVQCGTKLFPKAKFCAGCGHSIII